MSRPIPPSRWLLIGALLTLPACTPTQPPPTPTPTLPFPTTTPVASPTPESIDPTRYPVRYYHDDAGVSLEPPVGWRVSEIDDTILAQVEEPDTDITFILFRNASDGQRVAPINAAFVETWLGAGAATTEVDEAYTFANGLIGWHRAGLNGDSRWRVVTFSDSEYAYHLAFQAKATDFFDYETLYEAAAHSLNVESNEAQYVQRETALVLSSGEPLTLDPALTHFGSTGLMGDLFSGLVVLDPSLQIRPALAERWEVSSDGTVYTFHLRPNARFHNGRPVTAHDVLFSWERAAHPDTGSETVLLYMNDIVGIADYHAGLAETIAGVEVLDAHTLQVTLDGPKPYFLAKLSYPVSWVVDRYTVSLPNWEEHPNGTGPFRHRQHIEDNIFIVESNPFYYADPPPLEHIVYSMYAGYAQRLYQNDEVDYTGLTRDQRERANDPSDGLYGNVFTESNLCTSFVTFNAKTPPFDDPLVRRAFAHAVDRARYVEAITNGEAAIGRGVLPPGMPGFSEKVQPPAYDPELARALLAQSSYGGAGSLPPVVWTLRSSGGRYSSAAALLIDMWSDVLSVGVSVEGLDRESYYDQIDAGNFGHLLFEGWCADYPDPENFLDLLFHSASAQNYSGYSNPDYDTLIEQARIEPDVTARLALYQQAEQLLLDDAPAIFLSHSGPRYGVWKPYVHGYTPSPIGVPQHHLMWISEQ